MSKKILKAIILFLIAVLLCQGCIRYIIDDRRPNITDSEDDPPVNQKLNLTPVYIDTEDSAEVTSREEYVKATLSTEVKKEFAIDIRCRGNYSFIGVGINKKSYRIRFEEKVNFLGIGKGKARSYVLLANWCDRSLMRNAAAFSMAAELSAISFVPGFTYVKLYLNGDYLGIYQLCEQCQTGKNRVNIEENPDAVDADYLIELDCRAHKTMQGGIEYFVCDTKEYAIKNDEYNEGAAEFLKDYFDEVTSAIE
ncbi:MAG: CotH kinase family protein, partial [Clostridia bacterium]|nr:CotH kinase family protein [Clostridia bacterium]